MHAYVIECVLTGKKTWEKFEKICIFLKIKIFLKMGIFYLKLATNSLIWDKNRVVWEKWQIFLKIFPQCELLHSSSNAPEGKTVNVIIAYFS
jgi:hypothetical protein